MNNTRPQSRTLSVDIAVALKMQLGEGPVWDDRSQRLYWVDILAKTIFEYVPASNAVRSIQLGQMIAAIAIRQFGGAIVAGEYGFSFIDLQTGQLIPIGNPELDRPGNRFNDGKCDPAGNFWAGTMLKSCENRAEGALYRLGCDLSAKKILENVTISNGITWTSDRMTMYYIDTPTHSVDAFDYDVNDCTISNRRVAIHVPTELGLPDGMAIDENDHLWVAMCGGGSVCHFDPARGTLVEKVLVPATNVTSCIFGGEDRDRLFITTARIGLNEDQLENEPNAGSIFVANAGVKGSPMFQFAG